MSPGTGSLSTDALEPKLGWVVGVDLSPEGSEIDFDRPKTIGELPMLSSRGTSDHEVGISLPARSSRPFHFSPERVFPPSRSAGTALPPFRQAREGMPRAEKPCNNFFQLFYNCAKTHVEFGDLQLQIFCSVDVTCTIPPIALVGYNIEVCTPSNYRNH
mgnify:CR=1 FL=1